MKNIAIYFCLSLFFYSCKSTKNSIGHFATIKFTPADRKAVSKKESESVVKTDTEQSLKAEILTTEKSPTMIASEINGKTNNEEIVKKHISNLKKTTSPSTTTNKLKLKDKILLKVLNKKLNNEPHKGLNGLERNIRIGIILMAVGLGLSILGFGQIGSLAVLIGLVFLIIGLLNS